MLILQQLALAAGLLLNVNCMSHTIYSEARGESDRGRSAVAHVILNRLGPGDSICSVVTAPGQFHYDEPIDDFWLYAEIMLLSLRVLEGGHPDPTHGATFFFAQKRTTPYWAMSFRRTAKIGDHTFMKESP